MRQAPPRQSQEGSHVEGGVEAGAGNEAGTAHGLPGPTVGKASGDGGSDREPRDHCY